jgi:hypothetical protein
MMGWMNGDHLTIDDMHVRASVAETVGSRHFLLTPKDGERSRHPVAISMSQDAMTGFYQEFQFHIGMAKGCCDQRISHRKLLDNFFVIQYRHSM